MLRANITNLNKDGVVTLYHGYSEADVNSIIPSGHNDPYSGFPGYRSVRCSVTPVKNNEEPEVPQISVKDSDGAFTFNRDKCTGCGACVVACMDRNSTDLNSQHSFRKVWEDKNNGDLCFDMNFCVHCNEPACLEACKFGAVSKNEQGLVMIDSEKCVACGACARACPYKAINKGKSAYKCDGCADRTALGLAPVCVDACRFGALGANIR